VESPFGGRLILLMRDTYCVFRDAYCVRGTASGIVLNSSLHFDPTSWESGRDDIKSEKCKA